MEIVFLGIAFVLVVLMAASLSGGGEPKSLFGQAHYEVYPVEGGWTWRLRAVNGEVVAQAGQVFLHRSSAARAVEAARRSAPARVVEFL